MNAKDDRDRILALIQDYGNDNEDTISLAQTESTETSGLGSPRIMNRNKIYDDLIKAQNACDKTQFTSDYSENDERRISKKTNFTSSLSEASDEGFHRRLPEVPDG
ncbi:hypothetical protein JTB14_033864 [Gonioctena quinquepunctata]|nr:hypothetical protein JTB14_033864 [Gonioctena quinquepunctata]